MQLKNLVILNYHKVSATSDIGLTARPPEQFKSDLQLFKELGFTTVTFQQLLQPTFQLPKNALMITFDDGYKCVLEQALPLMQTFGFKGVVYMPAAYIGKTNDWDVQFAGKKFEHLSAQDLVTLSQAGFEIGSHGLTHRSLNGLSVEQQQRELRESKQILEQIVQRPVVSLSYPFGRFNLQLVQLSQSIGYHFAVGAVYFNKNGLPQELHNLALRRFNIYRSDSPWAVRKKLTGNFHSFYGYRDWLIQKGSWATIAWQKIFKNGSKP